MLDTLFFVGLCFLLWKVLKDRNFKVLKIRQRFLIYSALALLVAAIWIGLSYVSEYLIWDKNRQTEILNIVPIKAFLGFLMYLTVIHFFHTQLNKQQISESMSEAPDELTAETPEIEKLERITVKTGQKINMILIPEIVYFQAEGDYVRIFTDTNKFLKEDTIKYFQTHLPENQFVRVHRSYLVNVSKILRIELYGKQNQQLTLSNGDKLKISASGYKRLREVLNL
jgi:hypothetical protein